MHIPTFNIIMDIPTLNAKASIIMTTVVLYASVCHYPLMRQDSETWKENLIRTLSLFGAPTLIEACTEIMLVCEGRSKLNAFLLFLIWGVSCPVLYLHVRLSDVWNRDDWEVLLVLNWVRVFLWSVKCFNTWRAP